MNKQPCLWERQAGETDRAYFAFCCYRDMAALERSIDAAYRKSTANPPQNGRAPKQWFLWSADNQWKMRAEVWDAEQERKRREHVEATQREELDEFRLQLRKDNTDFAKAARISMQKALESLERLSDEDLSARDAARLLMAATVAIKTANEIQAQALGLDELVGMLNDDANRDDERAGGAREKDTAQRAQPA